MKVLCILAILILGILGKDENVMYNPRSANGSIKPKHLYNRCVDERGVSNAYIQVDSWVSSLYAPCYERTTLYVAPDDSVLRIQCSVLDLRCSYDAAVMVVDERDSSMRYLYRTTDAVTTKGNRMRVKRRNLYSPCQSTCTITSIRRTTPVCNCGVGVTNRIVGGTSARDTEFPWQVFLYTRSSAKRYCSGALISYNWVLTAASCRPQATVTQMWLGTSNPYDSSKYNQYRIAKQVYVDTRFYGSNLYDIALIKMNQRVEFNNYIRPICLPFNIPSNYDRVYTAGWGSTASNSHSGSPQLKKTTLYVVANYICSQRVAPSFTITSAQICAEGYRTGACEGDTGTSLVYNYDGRLYSVGVFSIASSNCASAPSVFTRVTGYLSWIQSTIDDPLCK